MLKGPRVTLRLMTREDVPRQNEFDQVRELYVLDGSIPPPGVSMQQTEAFFERRARIDWDHLIPLAIEVDGKYVGGLELGDLDRRQGTCELGIQIGDPEYWGKGYGREAIGLLVDWGFGELNLRRIGLKVASDNERAIRCYRACGFVEEGRQRKAQWLSGRYIDWVLMSILREEWEALRATHSEPSG